MAYQVLARKWRPQRFDDVIGQRGVTQTLRNAIAAGRIAQSFVITGPGGVAWTRNEGRKWHLIPGLRDFWAVAFANPSKGWLVGTEGRILKISF